MPSLNELIVTEISDFFTGIVEMRAELGGPQTPEEAQTDLIERLLAALAGMSSEPPKVMGYVSGRAMMRMLRGRSRFCSLYPEPKGEYCIEIYLNPPPPAPVPDDVIGCMAALAAAISLLERGGKKGAPSDKMFEQMLKDYKKALNACRVAVLAAAPEQEM